MLCSNLHSFWIAGKIDKKLPGTHVVRTNLRVYTPELKLAFTLLHSAIVISVSYTHLTLPTIYSV